MKTQLLLFSGLELAGNHAWLQTALSNHIIVIFAFMRNDVQIVGSHIVSVTTRLYHSEHKHKSLDVLNPWTQC